MWSSSAARWPTRGRRERWDSLRLLTPNWQSRLPGYGYEGDDPDGFRTMPETIAFIEGYAQAISAPVRTHTAVSSVRPTGEGYEVATDQGPWQCQSVVLASGACNLAQIPALAQAVPSGIAMLTPMQYRNPGQLANGGVLVVGASATGTQIAEELHRSGRPVTLAVGEHVRVPRLYRDKDIQWWMDAAGVLDERYDEVDDINRARNVPSLQLAGSPERRTVDLNALTGIGVKLIGRLAGIHAGQAQFSGSLRNQCALADLKMNRLLDTIDEWAAENGFDRTVSPPHRFAPTQVEASPPLGLDLTQGCDPNHPLGDRVPPRLLVARGAGLGPQRPRSPRRGGGRGPRHVSDGHPFPAAPQVESHRRRRRRRSRPERSPGLLPRRPKLRVSPRARGAQSVRRSGASNGCISSAL